MAHRLSHRLLKVLQQSSSSKPRGIRWLCNGGAPEKIRPYSNSLPSPGHEWCSRCQIPVHSFEKPLGQPDPCCSSHLPWMMGWCPQAQQYVKQQVATLLIVAAACFITFPAVNKAKHQQKVAQAEEDGRGQEKTFSC